MNCLQLLLGLIVVLPTVLGRLSEDCKEFILLFNINGVNYTRENLKNILKARSLSYDRTTNTLFFKYYVGFNSLTALPGKINLNTNEFETIEGVDSVKTVSVDAKTNDVYFQVDSGVYKYDKVNNKLESNATITDLSLFSELIFTKSNVFFVRTFPSWTLLVIENGPTSIFADLDGIQVRDIVIDDDDKIFFTNKTGLYRQKLGGNEAVYYEAWKKPGRRRRIQDVTLNNLGDVYAFSTSYGIYALRKNTTELIKILDVSANGLTFDGDNNMIYSDFNNLYRLKPNPNVDPNCVFNVIKN